MISTLSQLVALVESRNVPWAVRFEPGWANRWLTGREVDACIAAHAPAYMNRSTATVICSCSFGAYQLMGSNLYLLGYKKPVAAFMSSEADQFEYFGEYCESRKIMYSLDEILHDESKRQTFAIKYNGSAAYGQKLLDAYKIESSN